jgi:hypothetical protein
MMEYTPEESENIKVFFEIDDPAPYCCHEQFYCEPSVEFHKVEFNGVRDLFLEEILLEVRGDLWEGRILDSYRRMKVA